MVGIDHIWFIYSSADEHLAISTFCLLRIMLLCGHTFSFLLGICPRVTMPSYPFTSIYLKSTFGPI